MKNEYCFCQNTKADSILEEYEILHSPRYAGLLNRWKSILHEAAETEEYNPDEEYTYGLYQLNEEVNITAVMDGEIDGFINAYLKMNAARE